MDSNAKKKLIQFLENGQVDLALRLVQEIETKKSPRTNSQNRALHLWFTQIAQTCQDNGIDAKLLMSKTMHVEVSLEVVKAMWKSLQNAYYGKKSTTELAKTGEIDKLQDHFIRFFANNFSVELPPFPQEEGKDRQLLEALTLRKKLNYPEV